MSCVIIYPELLSPTASSDPPKSVTGSHIAFIRSCFGWGLHGSFCYQQDGSLLHYLSTLTCRTGRRYISVALSLESPPPDVIRHPALRSPDFPHLTPFGSCQLRLHTLLVFQRFFILPYIFCFVYSQSLLYIKTTVSHKFSENRVMGDILTWNPYKIIQKL